MRIHLIGEAGNHRDELLEYLQTPAEIVAQPVEAATDDAFDSDIAPDDVVVSLRFSRSDAQAPAFRLLHVPGAGLDRIDQSCLRPGTEICNVFEHEVPIAEYVLTCILESALRLDDARAAFTTETWASVYRDRPLHGEVAGKRLGILGYGRIGRAIAARARAFGMDVVPIDVFADNITVWGIDRLPELLETVDFIVVALPLTPETAGLLGETQLALLRSEAILINISRAEVVDEHALYAALSAQRIAGAFLDVWYRYPEGTSDSPPPSSEPLLALPNVWGTPHISAWTTELPARRYRIVAENINRLANGEELVNRITRRTTA